MSQRWAWTPRRPPRSGGSSRGWRESGRWSSRPTSSPRRPAWASASSSFTGDGSWPTRRRSGWPSRSPPTARSWLASAVQPPAARRRSPPFPGSSASFRRARAATSSRPSPSPTAASRSARSSCAKAGVSSSWLPSPRRSRRPSSASSGRPRRARRRGDEGRPRDRGKGDPGVLPLAHRLRDCRRLPGALRVLLLPASGRLQREIAPVPVPPDPGTPGRAPPEPADPPAALRPDEHLPALHHAHPHHAIDRGGAAERELRPLEVLPAHGERHRGRKVPGRPRGPGAPARLDVGVPAAPPLARPSRPRGRRHRLPRALPRRRRLRGGRLLRLGPHGQAGPRRRPRLLLLEPALARRVARPEHRGSAQGGAQRPLHPRPPPRFLQRDPGHPARGLLRLVRGAVALPGGQGDGGEPVAMSRRGFRDVVVGSLLLVAVLVLANYLAQRYPWRWDATAAQLHTLSGQTLRLLASLRQDVRIIAFYDDDHPGRPKAQGLLEAYAYRAPTLRWELVDPVREATRARHYRVTEQGTLVVESDGRLARLDGLADLG